MQLDTMKTEFEGAVIKRGETTGFGRWGGAISFDRPTNWHFNHMTDPMGGQIDFFSVALHELAHALGLGASKEWDDLVSGTTFTGTNAKAAHTPTDQTDQPPLVSTTDTGHWSQMIATSPVFDSPATLQTPLMVPSLGSNTRRKLTRLDAAALVDLGWEINLPISGASSLVSGDAPSVSSGFAALSASVVPEPAGVVLVVMGAMFAVAFRSRARG